MTQITNQRSAANTRARRGAAAEIIDTGEDTSQRSRGFLPALMFAFLISLVIPAVFFLGPVRLSPYRILLLIGFFPIMLHWLQGNAGRRSSYDFLFLFAFAWAFIGFIFHYGAEGIESGSILLVESAGAYFLARTAIRTPADFQRMVALQVLILVVLFPFAILETMTGRPFIIEIVSRFTATVSIITDPARLGLERVQGTFEHSILYGVFCASGMAGMHYVFNRGRSLALIIPGYFLIMVSTFLSLSSAAMMALMVQFIIIGWDWTTKNVLRRWSIFGWGCVFIYFAIDLLSNRTPFHVITSYLTFNSGSGYNRILIWRYGTQNVAEHPMFGVGLFGDWERPAWMGDSVDNFWLLIAMRHGLPTVIALALALFIILRKMSWVELKSPSTRTARAAYLASLGGLLLASGTVHFWNTMYVWFIFLMGSGVFLLDYKEPVGSNDGTTAEADEDDTLERRRRQYSRVPLAKVDRSAASPERKSPSTRERTKGKPERQRGPNRKHLR